MKELSIEQMEVVSGGDLLPNAFGGYCRPVIGFYWMGVIQLAISLYEGCEYPQNWDYSDPNYA